MLLLAFDTTGPNCAAAVARAGAGGRAKILAQVEERIGRGHAERLPPMVDEALSAAKAKYADLGRIAVTTGPGSFTGVRVGVAFARGLALALDIPAVGVGSLDALAFPLKRSGQGTIAAVLDAKRSEVYALVVDIASGAVLVEAEALRIEDLVLRLSHARRPITLTGAGARLVLSALGETDAAVAGEAEAPDIASVVALAFDATKCGPPLPAYARAADAKPQLDKALARL
ncbi:MAG: tRNA (adenosine(37)-N6)-threonylcarbamoyltransferase complex dimerization subunit type 1 TsaB [Propylenella sp.]